jgi:F-type H+-transporting ATPase subunit epsilon
MADNKIELRVIAPTTATDKSPYKFKKDVDMVIMRCTTGDMGILPGRTPVSVVLDTGVLRIFDEEADIQERHLAVMGGVAHVSDNILTIISDAVQKPEDINADKATADLKELQSLYDKTDNLNEKQNLSKDIHKCKILLEVAGTVKK